MIAESDRCRNLRQAQRRIGQQLLGTFDPALPDSVVAGVNPADPDVVAA